MNGRRRAGPLLQVVSAAGISLLPVAAGVAAQPPGYSGVDLDQHRRPGYLELPAPEYEQSPSGTELLLPPVMPRGETNRSGSGMLVHVQRIALVGNRVFTDAQLADLVRPYEGRAISADELLELRDGITLRYIESGYLNSGAQIPDQQVVDGVITLRIVEGELTSLAISGNERLRADYVRQRILPGAGPPLNVNALQEQLELLQENPLIERINASLSPGARPGMSDLDVRLREARPYSLEMELNNHRPPGTGAEQLAMSGAHRNLSGRGDTLEFSYSLTEGLDDAFLAYRLPVSARDSELGLYAERTDAQVIEAPFDELDIASDSWTAGVSYTHPLYRKPGEHLQLELVFERRRSTTWLLGDRFSFAPGVNDGRSDVSVFRFAQEWLQRSRDQVTAARSVFSFGTGLLGATDNDSGPDGTFNAWLGQLQWARRTGGGRLETVFRTDLQLSDAALLPMEKFVVGGVDTVRGYRENQLVRDNGLVVSLEFRMPVFTGPARKSPVRLAVFSDYGCSWNRHGWRSNEEIASAGAGILFDRGRFHARLYLAEPVTDIDNGNVEHDLQDEGVSFQASYDLL